MLGGPDGGLAGYLTGNAGRLKHERDCNVEYPPVGGSEWECAEVVIPKVTVSNVYGFDTSMGALGIMEGSVSIPFPLAFDSMTFDTQSDLEGYLGQGINLRSKLRYAVQYLDGPNQMAVMDAFGSPLIPNLLYKTNIDQDNITLNNIKIYVFAKLR